MKTFFKCRKMDWVTTVDAIQPLHLRSWFLSPNWQWEKQKLLFNKY